MGLTKRGPTRVRFCKGVGLIGVCLANNDTAELLVLDASTDEYQAALKLSESAWANLDKLLTHGVSLAGANLLAHRYGMVLAKVVQDSDSGEAIGCVTISVCANDQAEWQILSREEFRMELESLARSAASTIAI